MFQEGGREENYKIYKDSRKSNRLMKKRKIKRDTARQRDSNRENERRGKKERERQTDRDRGRQRERETECQ